VNPTYPHDYRLFFEGDIKPLVVGGQAVNLWAITFLEKGDRSLTVKTFGSEDMDLLDEAKVLEFLASAPGWNFTKRGVKDPFDIRVGRATSTSEDNRVLLVEIVKGVNGLEKEDIVASTVEYHGTVYRLLDPIALLKAKAANIRELDQTDRHDREHLKLIVACLPHFISAVLKNAKAEEKAPKTVSRLFSTLQHKKTAETLRNEGIDIPSLITNEIKNSSVPKIQKACEFQMPRLVAQEAQTMAQFCEATTRELKTDGLNHVIFSPGNKRLLLIEKAANEGHIEASELRITMKAVQKLYGEGSDTQTLHKPQENGDPIL